MPVFFVSACEPTVPRRLQRELPKYQATEFDSITSTTCPTFQGCFARLQYRQSPCRRHLAPSSLGTPPSLSPACTACLTNLATCFCQSICLQACPFSRICGILEFTFNPARLSVPFLCSPSALASPFFLFLPASSRNRVYRRFDVSRRPT